MENFQNTYQLLESTDWTLDKTTSDGNKIYYVNRKPYGKIYRITVSKLIEIVIFHHLHAFFVCLGRN